LKSEGYIPYREIAGQLGIEAGSILWLAADLTRLALQALRHEGSFDAFSFIASFQEKVGENGTLLIPSFNFNLRNNHHYSRKNSTPITGALATAAMQKGDFIRTTHPLHSFLVWGKESSALEKLNNKSSFGPDSPFEFLHNYQAKMLIIGTSVSNAFTFVHFVEELEQVKYRKYKNINIFLEDEGQWQNYKLFAKKTGWTMDMAGLEKLLEDKHISSVMTINGIPCVLVDLASSLPVIREDIRSNNAGNIARFSMKLYLRDAAKAMLATAGIRTKTNKISHDPGLH
jgi:aminoglycoside 3-N-acetyltransferase